MVNELERDDNNVPVAGGVSSADSTVILPFKVDSVTGRLLVDSASGSGTVTSVSVVSANGFAGSVANATTTPAITISTTINSPVLAGNGTAISAATTTGSGSTVVLATSPTLVTPNIGAATGTSLSVSGSLTSATSLVLEETGAGSDTITIQAPASIAASYTLTLPIDDGASGEVLSTDGNGVLSWVSAGGVPTTITVANEATDTSCFLAFFTAATGDLGPKTNANLTFNSNTGVATFGQTIVGSISGNAATVTVADAGGDTTTWVLLGTAQTGNLSPATDDTLTYNATTGALTATSFVGSLTGNAATFTVANEATDTTCFPVFVTAATGSLEGKSNAGLTFNSNTALLTATLLAGTTSVTTAALRASSNDSGSIGVSGTAFSDLFLASGAVIDFAAGNSVITHSSAVLTVSTGDLRVTTAGTNSASVVTVGGTQTLTSKTLTSPAITTGTYSGAQLLAEGASIALDPVLSADGTYSGITIEGTAGATLAFGDLIYLAAVDSRWELADASATGTAGAILVGICVLAAASDGSPTTILLKGNIRADTAFPTFTVSAPVYISETAGDVTNTAPTTSSTVVRVVGHGLDGNTLLFNPDPTWIVLA